MRDFDSYVRAWEMILRQTARGPGICRSCGAKRAIAFQLVPRNLMLPDMDAEAVLCGNCRRAADILAVTLQEVLANRDLIQQIKEIIRDGKKHYHHRPVEDLSGEHHGGREGRDRGPRQGASRVTKLAAQINESIYAEIKVARVQAELGKIQPAVMGGLPLGEDKDQVE